jgi:1-acyl-sn-glycerol-3-phosphate acyltransferase
MLPIIFSPLLRLEVEGRENVPRKGKLLVLSNHVGFLDPFVVCMATQRMVQFMATPTLFTRPILGPICKFFGVVPKRKFYADLSAIIKLIEWTRFGSPMGLYPEGQRTWDGHTLDIVPGIGKLVRIINAPVVILRMYNLDRLSPRWAVRQRRGHVVVKIDKPIKFDRKTPPAEIEKEIQKRIHVDPLDSPPALTYGKDRALGIRNVLFLCPHCYAFETLIESGNTVRCGQCSSEWIVGADNVLRSTGSDGSVPLVTALDQIREYMRERDYIVDRNRFDLDGVALESKDIQLFDIAGKQQREIGSGHLHLTKQGLRLEGTGVWEIAWKDLLVATVDLSTDLQFRSNKGLFRAVLTGESVVKWEWFTNYWMKKMRDQSKSSSTETAVATEATVASEASGASEATKQA